MEIRWGTGTRRKASVNEMLSTDAQEIVGYWAGCWSWHEVIEEDQEGRLHPH